MIAIKTNNFYRGKDSVEKFCANLRKHATEIIKSKKKMLSMEKKKKKKEIQKNLCHICEQEFSDMFNEDKKLS